MVKKDPMCQLYLRGLKKKCLRPIKVNGSVDANKKSRSHSKVETNQIYRASVPQNTFSSQTEDFFEMLELEPVKVETTVQTDPVNDTDIKLLGLDRQRPTKTGTDAETYIEPGELWNFNEAVGPIVESLTVAVIETV
jgi:hypothetical protein